MVQCGANASFSSIAHENRADVRLRNGANPFLGLHPPQEARGGAGETSQLASFIEAFPSHLQDVNFVQVRSSSVSRVGDVGLRDEYCGRCNPFRTINSVARKNIRVSEFS